MKDLQLEMAPPARARDDVPSQRRCLRCQLSFWSEGFGQRICPRCKATVSWKSAIVSGDGRTRRR